MDPSGSTRHSVTGTTLALLLLAVTLSGFLLLQSSLFSVGTVVIQGNRYVDESEILRIAGIGSRLNIFRLNVTNIQQRLNKDLRIASAEVSRRLPGTIIITVQERQPVAFIATNYGFAQIDSNGMILAVAKSLRRMEAPLITGRNIGSSYVGETVESSLLLSICQYLSALNESAFNWISEIHIDTQAQLIGYTVNGSQIKLGEAEQMLAKAAKTSAIIANEQNALAIIEYIDVSYATPYVKFKKERGVK